jgi:branched-chain amino acid transport system ATP-binding protein
VSAVQPDSRAAAATPALLEIVDLHVAYGQVEAVRGVSLALGSGQIVSVIGPNGAGKTTLLAAAMGLLPSRGGLVFEGTSLADVDVEARVERGLTLVPEQRELFGALSVADNLLLGGYARRLGSAERARSIAAVFARFPKLAERRAQLASTLSGGERQMLALGRALMSRPRLLMLDEPSLGLAPLIVREILAIVRALRDEGVAILLIEQNARAALEISDHGYVLETGEIVLAGAAAALAGDSRVQATYLGGATDESGLGERHG